MSENGDLVTSLLSLWMILGMYFDGWAHINRPGEDTFFTPWHGPVYSGFGVTAAWLAWNVYRFHQEGGRSWRESVPVGYGLALVGVISFSIGGAGDIAWHEILGIEVSIEALLSPSHLALFMGFFLITSAPLRAAWKSDAAPGSFKSFFPELLSMTMVAMTAAFVFQYLVVFQLPGTMALGTEEFKALGEVPPPPDMIDAGVAGIDVWERTSAVRGIASILLTTMMMVAPMLLLLRRWRKPPFGYTAFLFLLLAVATNSLREFRLPWLLLAPLIAGLVADFLIHRWDPNPENVMAFRLVPAVASVVLWISFFVIYEIAYDIGWNVELWAGITFLTGLEGFGLSLLIMPPSIPVAAYSKPLPR